LKHEQGEEELVDSMHERVPHGTLLHTRLAEIDMKAQPHAHSSVLFNLFVELARGHFK
jgi:hypothetical protein